MTLRLLPSFPWRLTATADRIATSAPPAPVMNFRKREPDSPRSVLEDPPRHRGILPAAAAAIGGIAAAVLHHRNKSKQQQQEEVLVPSSSGRYSCGSEIVLHGSSPMAHKGQPVARAPSGGMVVPYMPELSYEQQQQMYMQQQYAAQQYAQQRGDCTPRGTHVGFSPQKVASFGPAPVPSSMVLNIYTGEPPPPPVEPPAPPRKNAVVNWLKQTGIVGVVSIAVWEIVRNLDSVTRSLHVSELYEL